MKDNKKKKDSSITSGPQISMNEKKVQNYVNRLINKKVIKIAVDDALLNPRTAMWCPEIKAITNCHRAVTPGFSVSKDMSDKLKMAYHQEDPDLYNAVTKRLDRHCRK